MRVSSRLRRGSISVAVIGAVTLTLVACSSDSSDSTKAASSSSAAGPQAEFLTLTGATTSVDLDAGTAKVLADNGVTVAPVGPATASVNGDTTTVTFPITQGYVAVYPSSDPSYIRGAFSHSGGLTFSAGGTSLTVTDFIVNPGDSTLTATVEGAGAAQILDLDGSAVQVTTNAMGQTQLDGTVAKLSQTAADALNQTFGVSLFTQGIPLGRVSVVAAGNPGPMGVAQAQFLTLTGASTSVAVDAGTAKVLTDNGVTVEPVGPATASVNGDITTVSFPITQGYVAVFPSTDPSYIRGAFSHSGGLKFSAGGKSLTVTDFVVNPGDSTLTATVEGAGAAQILDLDGSAVQVSTNAQGQTQLDGTVAKLSQTAANALNKTFGVSLFAQGIPLGVVSVVAAGNPVPGD